MYSQEVDAVGLAVKSLASAGDEREAFEREYLKANYPRVHSGELSAPPIFGRVGSLKFRGQSEGDYEDSDIQLCWAMWQARAVLSANHSEQVPKGWQLVPVEPTPEILRAMQGLMVDVGGFEAGLTAAYRAAIAAAPSAGSQKEQGE